MKGKYGELNSHHPHMIKWTLTTGYSCLPWASFRFGLESVKKMVDWIADQYPIPNDSTKSPSILEIGCGNGTLLFAVHEAGYDPKRMHGIDYSEGAISLAKSIASEKDAEDATSIRFTTHDFLTEDLARDDTTSDGWDLILDKGTFDAISLGKKDENGCAPHWTYPQRLSALMKPGGRFLITCKTCFNLCCAFRRLTIS
jgi:SAM-dependent methyltransferase